jgi:hypothetical protein
MTIYLLTRVSTFISSINDVSLGLRKEMEIQKQEAIKAARDGRNRKKVDVDDEIWLRIMACCNTGPVDRPISVVSLSEKRR